MRILILALLLAPIPAMASDQFNLVCDGSLQISGVARPKPAQRVYRVDLTKNAWCVAECSIVHPIVDVQDARITFQSIRRYGVQIDHYVNRVSGAVSDLDFNGKCSVAPFTGIPERKF